MRILALDYGGKRTGNNDAVADMQSISVLNMIMAAGWVMIPLALASMITFTLIIYCFFTLREKSIVTPELLERMEPFFENEDLDGLAAYVADRPQATARMVDNILLFLEMLENPKDPLNVPVFQQ